MAITTGNPAGEMGESPETMGYLFILSASGNRKETGINPRKEFQECPNIKQDIEEWVVHANFKYLSITR